MCDAVSISAAVAAAAAATGGAMQYKSSQAQASAMGQAQEAEGRRQGEVMRSNISLQNQQRQDAEKSHKAFQQDTLPAFTRKGLEADQATEQTRLQGALVSAGNRAITPGTGDAAAANTSVSTGGGAPSAPTGGSQAYSSALSNQLAYGSAYNADQGKAQAAMLALSRAQQMGGDRLQLAGQSITLRNAKLAALNRAISANGLYSNTSTEYYQSQAGRAANAGAGLGLAGGALSTLGNAGYSYASGAGDSNTGFTAADYANAPRARPVT